MKRRDFLVVGSAALAAPMAMAHPVLGGLRVTGSTRPIADPIAATLLESREVDGARRVARLARASAGAAEIGAADRRLILRPLESRVPLGWGADLELIDHAGRDVHLWSCRNDGVVCTGTGLASRARTSVSGLVSLRVTVRRLETGLERSTDVRLSATPGAAHVIAVPLSPEARTPTLRRCTAEIDPVGLIDRVTDPLRPHDAAPGCVLLAIAIRNTEPESTPTEPAHAL